MKTKKNYLLERIESLVNTGACNKEDFNSCVTRSKFEDFTFDFEIEKMGKDLLRKAYECLKLSQCQLERIERITKAVMQLDKKTIAEACHIAEAIQYCQ